MEELGNLLKCGVAPDDECIEWGASFTNGYAQISTKKANGKRGSLRVHRALREIIEGESDLGTLHRCGNKACISPGHTYYGTKQDNWADVVRLGESRDMGETHHAAKLTQDQVNEIRRRYVPSRGRRIGNGRELELEFGLSRSYVSQIVRGSRWAS